VIQATTERWSYTFLMTSLPAMPPRFDVARLPISAAALEERLARIPDEDLQIVEKMRDLLFWDRLGLALTDDEIIKQYQAFLAETNNEIARQIVSFRMDVRTIVAALRCRRRGIPLPSVPSEWMRTIKRHFAEPSLGLGTRFPWIASLDKHFAEGDVDEADRILLDIVYEQWSRWGAGRPASFESLLLYVARWDVIHRFVSRNRELGEKRMEQLVTEAIGDYRRLF
jgi:hypothetical protein